MTKVFITGKKGFVASHFIEFISEQKPEWTFTGTCYDADYIIHLGASTRIADSIEQPRKFFERNIGGTFDLLQDARHADNLKAFVYFSTDEVFGRGDEFFQEWDGYNPMNPYAATKAAGEELCMAWAATYGIPVIVTHCMNLYGERQPKEKFFPTIMRQLLADEPITIYTDERTHSIGTRDYLHAKDAASAVLFLLEHQIKRDKFNISRHENGPTPLEFVLAVADILKVEARFVYREGPDPRCGLDGEKLKLMGWQPKPLLEYLVPTVLEESRRWTKQNR
jgi:dTDP-glucose 4,6-dehydratase